MINMVRAGEVGGFLDSVMMQLAVNFESEVKLRGKVKSAMTYPVVVLCISVVAVIGMLLFIVPVFKKLFQQLGGKLPLPTQILVDLSGALKFLLPAAIVARDRLRRAVGQVQAHRRRSATSSTRSS